MNLELRILWFDDSKEYFDALDIAPLREKVGSWGFTLDIELVTAAEGFMSKKPWDRYDLIVVDYDLGQAAEHGEEFIKQIRNHKVFTEIVFYSSGSIDRLWDAILANRLEGVFISDRPFVLQKLEDVAHQSVQKVLDLNNMRGMVMAEVADIDQVIDATVTIGMGGLDGPQQKTYFGRFHEKAEKQAQDTLASLGKFKENPTIDEMLALSDSYKRWMNFKRLQNQNELMKDFQGNYSDDVLSPRNVLAHGMPRETDTGYIFTYRQTEYPFDQAVSLALRKTILEYRQKFQDIHTKLKAAGTK